MSRSRHRHSRRDPPFDPFEDPDYAYLDPSVPVPRYLDNPDRDPDLGRQRVPRSAFPPPLDRGHGHRDPKRSARRSERQQEDVMREQPDQGSAEKAPPEQVPDRGAKDGDDEEGGRGRQRPPVRRRVSRSLEDNTRRLGERSRADPYQHFDHPLDRPRPRHRSEQRHHRGPWGGNDHDPRRDGLRYARHPDPPGPDDGGDEPSPRHRHRRPLRPDDVDDDEGRARHRRIPRPEDAEERDRSRHHHSPRLGSDEDRDSDRDRRRRHRHARHDEDDDRDRVGRHDEPLDDRRGRHRRSHFRDDDDGDEPVFDHPRRHGTYPPCGEEDPDRELPRRPHHRSHSLGDYDRHSRRDRAGDRDRDRDLDRERDADRDRDRDRDRKRDADRDRDHDRDHERNADRDRRQSESSSEARKSLLKNVVWGAALQAGLGAAIDMRERPGPWMGEKGARVASAAVTSGLVDTFFNLKKPDRQGGIRHQAAKYGLGEAMGMAVSKAAARGMK